MCLADYYNSIDENPNVLLGSVGKEERAVKFLKKLASDDTYFELMIGIDGNDYDLAIKSCNQLSGIASKFGFTRIKNLATELISHLISKNVEAINTIFKELKKVYEFHMEMIAFL